MSRALPLALLLLAVAPVGPALAHPGGSNGYAVITIDGDRVRYRLTLWPDTLPSPVGEHVRRAREGDAQGAAHGRRCRSASTATTSWGPGACRARWSEAGRGRRWEAPLVRRASLAILLVGAVLFVERTLL